MATCCHPAGETLWSQTSFRIHLVSQGFLFLSVGHTFVLPRPVLIPRFPQRAPSTCLALHHLTLTMVIHVRLLGGELLALYEHSGFCEVHSPQFLLCIRIYSGGKRATVLPWLYRGSIGTTVALLVLPCSIAAGVDSVQRRNCGERTSQNPL